MKEFFEQVRWTAVGWIITWITVFVIATFLPEYTEFLYSFIGLGIGASILLAADRE